MLLHVFSNHIESRYFTFSGHICFDAVRMVVCSGIPFCGSIHHAAIPTKTFWWTANQGVSFLPIPSFIYLHQNFGKSTVFTLPMPTKTSKE